MEATYVRVTGNGIAWGNGAEAQRRMEAWASAHGLECACTGAYGGPSYGYRVTGKLPEPEWRGAYDGARYWDAGQVTVRAEGSR